MHRVQISLDEGELSDKMAQMRVWLDKNRSEPSAFICRGYGSALLVQIAFREAGAAAAFAQRFGGRMAAAA